MADLHILYFAWVRELIGRDGDIVARTDAGETISDVVARLRTLSPGHAEALAQTDRLRAALDHAFVPLDAPVGEARELALFPPVTGG